MKVHSAHGNVKIVPGTAMQVIGTDANGELIWQGQAVPAPYKPAEATIKNVATIERVQPVAVALENGELVWEGHDMPLWQRKMFPILYRGDFRSFWIKRAFYDATGVEIETPNMQIYGWPTESKHAAHGD